MVCKLGQGMYWQGSDKTHRPDTPTGRPRDMAPYRERVPRACTAK